MGSKWTWVQKLDMFEARKPTQVASQRGGREGKADDKRVSVSSRHHRYWLKGRFFQALETTNIFMGLLTCSPGKRGHFLCLIQIRCGGTLWKNERNSVSVTISQCVFSGGAHENKYEAETTLRGPLHSCINGCCPVEAWPGFMASKPSFCVFSGFFLFSTFH